MKDLLDKHLTEEHTVHAPKFFPVFQWLFIYFILLGIFMGTLIYIIGLAPLVPFQKGEFMYNLKEEVVRLGFAELMFFVSGHILQRKMYTLYNKSVLRSAMVPILFFNVFLTFSMINLFWSGEHQDESIWYIMSIWAIINGWIISLSLLVSWYFEHQKKWLYFLCIFGHWMLISLLGSYYVS